MYYMNHSSFSYPRFYVVACLSAMLSFSTFSITSSANRSPSLITCLAAEEEFFDKQKKSSAMAHLNKIFINRLSKRKSLAISVQVLRKVCQAPEGLRAHSLLQELIIHRNKSFMAELPLLLHDYIDLISTDIGFSGCIEHLFPKYKDFKTKIVYMRREWSDEDLLLSPGDIRMIFRKISNIEKLKKQCSDQKLRQSSTPNRRVKRQ